MAKKPKTVPAADGEDAAGEVPKGSKKKIIMIGAAVLLLAGGGGFFMMKKKGGDDHAAIEVKKPLVFLEVREMTINLTTEPGQDKQRTAKVKVSLELKDAKVEGEVKPLMPRIEDTFQIYLRELRPSDLAGSAGLYRLREELLRRVNVAIYPARAEAVLFKDVIVQ